MELEFGTENVRKWADIDNNGDETFITNRINRALTNAEAQINVLFGLRGYEVPIAADPIPTIINEIAAKLAAVLLYESHGIKDFNESTGRGQHALYFIKREVMDWIRGFRAGLIEIPDLEYTTSSAPGVVKDE